MNPNQLTLNFDEARALGSIAGGQCLDATNRDHPQLREKAWASVLAYLAMVPQASCEDITGAVIAAAWNEGRDLSGLGIPA